MKNKTDTKMVDKLRKIRDDLNEKIKDLSYDELVKFLEKDEPRITKFGKRRELKKVVR